MNSFFGDLVVERIKFNSFNNEKKIIFKEDDINLDVTNKKYEKKINDVKNEKIKKSLIELTKVFKKR